MSSKHYMKSDGNGGFNIGRYTLTLLMLVVALMSAFIPVVIGYGRMQGQITNNIDDIDSLRHFAENIENRVDVDEQFIAEARAMFGNIDEKLEDIKLDLREHLRE